MPLSVQNPAVKGVFEPTVMSRFGVVSPLSPSERRLGRRGHGVARSGVGYGLPLQCATRNVPAARRGLAATGHHVDLKF